MQAKNSLKIVKDGLSLTTGATSARIALPTNAAGQVATIVRVSCPNSAHYAFVLPGNSTVNATTASVAIGNVSEVVLDVTGCTHIAHIQGSAAAIVNVSPVEW
jgi:hypothetical protein